MGQVGQTSYGVCVKSELGIHLAFGASVPSDTSDGYAPGCLFMKTGLTDQDDALYCNIGSATSANFNLVTVAADA